MNAWSGHTATYSSDFSILSRLGQKRSSFHGLEHFVVRLYRRLSINAFPGHAHAAGSCFHLIT